MYYRFIHYKVESYDELNWENNLLVRSDRKDILIGQALRRVIPDKTGKILPKFWCEITKEQYEDMQVNGMCGHTLKI